MVPEWINHLNTKWIDHLPVFPWPVPGTNQTTSHDGGFSSHGIASIFINRQERINSSCLGWAFIHTRENVRYASTSLGKPSSLACQHIDLTNRDAPEAWSQIGTIQTWKSLFAHLIVRRESASQCPCTVETGPRCIQRNWFSTSCCPDNSRTYTLTRTQRHLVPLLSVCQHDSTTLTPPSSLYLLQKKKITNLQIYLQRKSQLNSIIHTFPKQNSIHCFHGARCNGWNPLW